MTLLTHPMTSRLVGITARGKVGTAWLASGGAIDSGGWAAELDGTVSCDVEGVKTYFMPEHILAVRERPQP